jgi:hypothetical protein
MTLPLNAVERLFQRLSATYGSEFVNKWDKVSMSDVKTAWAHELAPFADNLNAIGWALQNLPDRCPNLMEFKNLCRQAPRPERLRLDTPKASPEIVDSEMAKIVTRLAKPKSDNADHRRWAKKLKERHEKGENLSIIQITSYKKALEINE